MKTAIQTAMKSTLKPIVIFLLVFASLAVAPVVPRATAQDAEPLQMAIARLTHGHVNWIFNRPEKTDVDLVAIYEPDPEIRQKYMDRHGLDADLFYSDLGEMLDAVQPEAVSAFGSIREHLEVVEAAAPRGVHVMVEKPLAFRMEDAERMRDLAETHDIHLITNYETTWYASVHAAKEVVQAGDVGEIRKMVIRDGHRGPAEIGVSDEFLEWLTDPVENGGGALIDFGCYGANLATWLMDGEAPLSVTAVTHTNKPDIYERVDDEATIVLQYPRAQAVIQASWNWPFNRKDMHVYGRTGYVAAPNGHELRLRRPGEREEEVRTFGDRPAPHADPFSYLAAVVRGDEVVSDTSLWSLENNVTVVRILDAARESARTGRTISFE